MRILMVSEDVPYPSMGGLAKHALNLARALVRDGHEVDFLGSTDHPIEAAGQDGIFGGRFFGELSGHHAGWKEYTFGMFVPQKRTWLAKRFAKAILRHASRYDVVHYHGHVPNVGRFIPGSVNFVQTRHDQGTDCFFHTRFRDGQICKAVDPAECASCMNRQANPLQKAISIMAVKRYRAEVAESFSRHKTVFVSDMLRTNCRRTLGDRSWGVTLHNFVDLDSLHSAKQDAPNTAHPGRINVFIACKLYPPKGVGAFLQEIAPVLPEAMHISIAGDGGEEALLRSRFGNDQIQFLGWCASENTLRLAAAADAIVVPSLWEEPFGTTILEGLLLGKPTYALNQGGTPEMAKFGQPGQLRLFDDISGLVQDLIALRPDKNRFSTWDQRAGAEYAAQQLLDIYRIPSLTQPT